jgi:hypothetical protein
MHYFNSATEETDNIQHSELARGLFSLSDTHEVYQGIIVICLYSVQTIAKRRSSNKAQLLTFLRRCVGIASNSPHCVTVHTWTIK